MTGEALAWLANFTSTSIPELENMYLTDLEWWYFEAKKANDKMYGGKQ